MSAFIAFPIFLALVWALAEQCAKWDAAEIDYRIANGGESLDHVPMWLWRAGIVGGGAIGCWLAFGLPVVPLLGIGAFGFSAWFRYRLNRLRGLDCRYVSPSNWYDWLFMAFDLSFQGHPHWAFNKRQFAIKVHEAYWKPTSFLRQYYVHHIHRAGTIAYITEITITAACIVWVGITLLP